MAKFFLDIFLREYNNTFMNVESGNHWFFIDVGTGGAAMDQTAAAPLLTGYFVGIGGQQSGPFDTAGLKYRVTKLSGGKK